MVFLCKFVQNPKLGSGDRVQTRLIFSLNLSQGHQNLIKSLYVQELGINGSSHYDDLVVCGMLN